MAAHTTTIHLDGDEVKDLLGAKVGSDVSFVVKGRLAMLSVPKPRPKKKTKGGELSTDFHEEPGARIDVVSIEKMKVGKGTPARDLNTKHDVEKAIAEVKGE